MSDDHSDVIVIGAGPVGLLTARLIGRAGHAVTVLERWPEPYPRPRAVHFDHEIARLLQGAGLVDQVLTKVAPVLDHYEWHSADGQPLVRIDWSMPGPSGWPVSNFFSQPELEQVLLDAVTTMPSVTVRRPAQVTGLTPTADGVVVTTAGGETLTASYVVGCDGANSFVREQMGTSTTDLGFHFDWLIVDTIPTDDREWSPMNWQLCDPARPTTIVSGGPGRRRWEFMLLPGETRADFDTEETAWRLLEPWGRTPENSILERHIVYTFQARWADAWNAGRLLIAGDAAHLMPPFAGQGMCSGLRDAANLAWKLDLVLRGESPAGLLDTYTSERTAHLQHAISVSVALGEVICVLDPAAARERDERMIAGGADPRVVLPEPPPERLGPGVWDDASTPESLRATLTPQFTVHADGVTGRFDDVVGQGFTLTGYGVDPLAGLSVEHRAVLDRLGVRTVVVDGPEVDGARSVASVDVAPAEWSAAHGVSVLLTRPDFYVFGAASTPDEVRALVELLGRQVLASPATASTPPAEAAHHALAAGISR